MDIHRNIIVNFTALFYLQLDIENSRKQLDLKDVDYEATMAAKISIAKRVYRLEKNQAFSSTAFKKYFEENKVSLFYLACSNLKFFA